MFTVHSNCLLLFIVSVWIKTMEVKKVRQMKTMLPSLIPTSQTM